MANKRKKVKQIEIPSMGKNPKIAVSPDSYLGKNPKWAFKRCDRDHGKWAINKENFWDVVLEKLIAYEGLTWSEINGAIGGKTCGNNNHFENVSELCKDAQKRLQNLKIYDDQLFSLRLTGAGRLYGILEDGVFNILWYDAEHEIYPSKKK